METFCVLNLGMPCLTLPGGQCPDMHSCPTCSRGLSGRGSPEQQSLTRSTVQCQFLCPLRARDLDAVIAWSVRTHGMLMGLQAASTTLSHRLSIQKALLEVTERSSSPPSVEGSGPRYDHITTRTSSASYCSQPVVYRHRSLLPTDKHIRVH